MKHTQRGSGTIGLISVLAVVVVIGGIVYTTQLRSTSIGDKNSMTKSLDAAREAQNLMEEDSTMKADVLKESEDGVEEPDLSMQDTSGATVKREGTYEDYSPEKLSMASTGDVVLFFHADWCPLCRNLEGELKGGASVLPVGVHVLKVDYDTAIALRQKYGVTIQHTFVQVDEQGNLITKWSDATTASEVFARLQ